MSPTPVLQSKPTTANKPLSKDKPIPVYDGPISPAGAVSGVVTKIQGPSDEVRLVVLNSLGDVISETVRPVSSNDLGLVPLSFQASVSQRAGSAPCFMVVKGFLKGAPSFETLLGTVRF